MPRRARRAVAAVTALAAMLIAASSAAAAQRYASPTGSGSACSSPNPCTIETAFSGANTGDEIIVAPGDYGPVSSNLFAPANGYVHGVHGQPAPRIHMASGHYVDTGNPGARVSYMQIDGIIPDPLEVDQNTQADQVYVHATGGNACLVYGTLIDAVCWTSAAGDEAINGAASATFTPVLRNVTAEATGSGGVGLEYHTSASGSISVTAVNLIVHGTATDIQVQADSPANTTVNIDHSNWVTQSVNGNNGHVNATNTQTQPPLFVNAAAGDFHEAAGSPTIDAGVTSPANGPFDFEGQPREMNGATDIGADEFDPFAGVVLASRSSKVKKRKATVRVACPANAPPPCAGTLTLTFSQGKKTKAAGSAAFSIEPGATEPVKVKLSKKALKRLDRRGKLPTEATATATDGAGVAKTTSGPVKLKPKRK